MKSKRYIEYVYIGINSIILDEKHIVLIIGNMEELMTKQENKL